MNHPVYANIFSAECEINHTNINLAEGKPKVLAFLIPIIGNKIKLQKMILLKFVSIKNIHQLIF